MAYQPADSTRDVLVEQLHTAARRGFRCYPTEETPQMLPAAEALPDDLPVPRDDGAARHLPGRTLPSLSFQATDGSHIQLDEVSPGR